MEWRPPDYEQILRELIAQNADIEGVTVITNDGDVVASVLPEAIDADRANFFSSALDISASLAANSAWGGEKSDSAHFTLTGSHGCIVALPLPNNMLIAAICGSRAKIGLVILDLGRVGKFPFTRASDPIIPLRPPGSLRAGAKPDYDDID